VFFFYTFSGSLRSLRFEFDPAKSTSNLAKHGIDFTSAQAMWEDVNYVEVPAHAGRATLTGSGKDRRQDLGRHRDEEARRRTDHLRETCSSSRGGTV